MVYSIIFLLQLSSSNYNMLKDQCEKKYLLNKHLLSLFYIETSSISMKIVCM